MACSVSSVSTISSSEGHPVSPPPAHTQIVVLPAREPGTPSKRRRRRGTQRKGGKDRRGDRGGKSGKSKTSNVRAQIQTLCAQAEERDKLIARLEDDVDALVEAHGRLQHEKMVELARADDTIATLQAHVAYLSDELTRDHETGADASGRRARRGARQAARARAASVAADRIAALEQDKARLLADRDRMEATLLQTQQRLRDMEQLIRSQKERRKKRETQLVDAVQEARTGPGVAPGATPGEASSSQLTSPPPSAATRTSSTSSASASASASSSSSSSSSSASASSSAPHGQARSPERTSLPPEMLRERMPSLKKMSGFARYQEDNIMQLSEEFIFRGRLFTGNGTVVFQVSPRDDPLAQLVVKIFNDNRYTTTRAPRVVSVMQSLRPPLSPHVLPMLRWVPLRKTGLFAVVYPFVPDASDSLLYGFLGRLSMKGLARYAYDVLLGLAYLHSQGLVYRDVKPDNILVDRRTQNAILIDFDTVGRYNPVAPPKSLNGSQGYLAPEIEDEYRRLNGYTPKVDVYSLGIVIFEMFHKVPYEYRGRVKRNYVEGILAKHAASRKPIHTLLAAMLQDNPDQRFSVDQCLQHPFFAKERKRRASQPCPESFSIFRESTM